ncbi:snaclec coagulation factor IX/factor X-binding protein subunit A-like isoform X2 [Notolabrus celidotus]|uniref:snaclec coagulation factor IX/factor X-binding protein subunit A-like isoform X2 n=1 Tax=Notolabrus celidotus TaxID=1203425 RepID=UPI00149029A7|nr:snaclec coagulation factor IX/factor X-binding protein subunit A-like isoform X2 [Notolabrus celidotus]
MILIITWLPAKDTNRVPEDSLTSTNNYLIITMRTALIVCIMLCAASAAPAEEKEQPAAAGGEVEHLAAAAPDAADVAVPELQEYQQLPEDELSAPQNRFFSCPSGWEKFKGTCFLYVHTAKSWTDAEAHCAEQGAHLTSIRNAFEHDFLQTLTLKKGGSTAWTGGYYFQNWRWLDHSPFNYNGWHYQPSGSCNLCTYLQAWVGWGSSSCGTRRPFICMMRTDGC